MMATVKTVGGRQKLTCVQEFHFMGGGASYSGTVKVGSVSVSRWFWLVVCVCVCVCVRFGNYLYIIHKHFLFILVILYSPARIRSSKS